MHTNSRRWVRNAVFAAGMFAAPAAQAQVEPMPAELRVAPAPGRRAVAAAWTPSFCAGAAGPLILPVLVMRCGLFCAVLREVKEGEEKELTAKNKKAPDKVV